MGKVKKDARYREKFVYDVAGPTGIEPAAYGLRVRRSGLTELRARTKASFERGFTEKYRAYGLLYQLVAVKY